MDFNFRQYDPQIGRFLSVDSLAAAQGQELHSPYAAMGNQPEMMIDPNGLAASPSMYVLHDKGDGYWRAVNAEFNDPLMLQEFGSYASYQNFLSAQRNIGASAALQDAYDQQIAILAAERLATSRTGTVEIGNITANISDMLISSETGNTP